MEQAAAISDAEVGAWLRSHPDFLVLNPGLYHVLAPPRRVHGEVLADHMAAMLAQARTRAREAERAGAQDAAAVAASRRAAESFTRRVQETVVALMRAPDAAWLATQELAGLMRVDAARVCSEALRGPTGAARIPTGTIATLLGRRAALVRPARPDPVLHGEAVGLAIEEALVRIPLMAGPALLVLASRDAIGLGGATTDSLGFLGQALGAALDRVRGEAPGGRTQPA